VRSEGVLVVDWAAESIDQNSGDTTIAPSKRTTPIYFRRLLITLFLSTD
jgi:hypothetical protein